MTLDHAVTAAERTEAARRLITRAQTETVDLVVVSALDLCALDGPRQPLFDERVAHAWLQLTERRRRKVTEEVTAGMVRRGLLLSDPPQRGTGTALGGYALQPELGLMLAARCRPAFIVTAAGEEPGLRSINLFALGDQAEPVQAIVAEVPTGLPPDRAAHYPGTRKLGPLGWLYRYVLVSSTTAAEILARWTMTPPAAQPGEDFPVRYLVSAYRPDREQPLGYHLSIRADGNRAVVDGLAGEYAGPPSFDLEELQGVMLNLLTEAAR
jgi:hypothetical protein